MRENLQNLVIVFAFAAAVATLGWFGYRALSADDEPAETFEVVAPGAPAEEASAPKVPVDDAAEPDETAAEAGESETPPTLEEDEAPARLPFSLLRDRVAGSTVIVESATTGRSLGAGVVIAPGLVATSAAVAERANGARARLLDSETARPIGRVARIDAAAGVALLEVPDLEASALAAPGVADVSLGDRIYALAGSGVGAGVSEGLVGSLRRIGGARAFTISVPIAASVEGGPVVDPDGALVGVAIRRVGEEGLEEVAIDVGAVRDLASGEPEEAPTTSRATPPPEPPPTARPPAEEPDEPARRAPRAAPEPARPAPSEPDVGAYERRFVPRDYLVTAATKLHERPDSSSHVIARLRAETVVTAVGEIEGWLRVRSATGRRDGYLPPGTARPLRVQ